MQRENGNKNVGQAMPDSKGNSFWKNEIRLIIRQAEPDLRVTTTNAFTLIELLVVVLIIGILAAVAVPKYQKAVAKSRYAALKPIVNSLAEAAQRYYLANGTYFTDWEELDIDTGGELSSDREYLHFPWGTCEKESTYKYLFCKHHKINISYLIYSSGQRYCVPYDAGLSTQICKEETNNTLATNGAWYRYP